MVLALSLARSGRTEEAKRVADEVSQEARLGTIVQRYLVPTVRAAIKLQQHDPAAAIDLLRGTVQYDLAYTLSFDYLYPAYIRVPGVRRWPLSSGRVPKADRQSRVVLAICHRPAGSASTR